MEQEKKPSSQLFSSPLSEVGIFKQYPSAIILLVFLGLGVFLYVARDALLPFAVSFALAYFLSPVIDFYDGKAGMTRLRAVILFFVLLTLISVLSIVIAIPIIVDQVGQLVRNIPGYLQTIRDLAVPFIEEWFEVTIPSSVEEIFQQLKASFATSDFSARSLLPVGSAVGQAFTSIFSLIMFLLNLFLVPVFTFYLLLEFPEWVNYLDSLVPRPYHAMVRGYARNLNTIISSFVRGQVTVCLVLGVLYSMGLWISGVPYWLLIGLFAGVIAFIPYLGFIGGIVPGIVLAYLTHGDLYHPAAVVISFTVVQLIESNVITPKIIGDSVGLNPIAVMLALILAGSFLGFLGLLIAVPAAAAIKVFFEDFIKYYKASPVYKGGLTSE